MEQYSLSTTNKSDKISIFFVTFTSIPWGFVGLSRHQCIIKNMSNILDHKLESVKRSFWYDVTEFRNLQRYDKTNA